MTGWIKLDRNIRENWIWQDPIKLKWWIDLLMEVNHCDKKVSIGYKVFDCKKGESLMSLQTWAKRWKVSKTVVNNFFKMLENDNAIRTVNETVTTRLIICNYASYQENENAFKTQQSFIQNATVPQQSTTKELEELKELKDITFKSEIPIMYTTKKFIIPSILEIKNYCNERKNSVDPEKFFNFYQSKGWLVGKSKMKDWKACIHTWEKSSKENQQLQTGKILQPKTEEKKQNLLDRLK